MKKVIFYSIMDINFGGMDMSKTLVLAEKPSVGREIARVLGCRKSGNGYIEGNQYMGAGSPGGAGGP